MSTMTERPRLAINPSFPNTPPPTYPSTFSSPSSYSFSSPSPYGFSSPSPYTFSSPGSYTSSPGSYTSPASPRPSSAYGMGSPHTPAKDREVFMGGFVNHAEPQSPLDEKRAMSIEVPGIVLTEPEIYHARTPSPSPKQILLLSPTSVALPLDGSSSLCVSSSTAHSHSHYFSSAPRPFSPAFLALINGRKSKGKAPGLLTTVRSVVLLAVVALCGWHLWSTVEIGAVVEEVVEGL